MAKASRPVSDNAAALVRRYLKDTAWHQARFGRLCGIKRSLLSLLLSGNRPFTAHTALLVEKATRAAKEAGLTTVEPITVAMMMPEMFPEAPASIAATG